MRFATGFFIVVALSAFGLAAWRFPPTDSSSAAAWLQAFFSIAAILASVLLVVWQGRRDMRKAEAVALDERLRYLDTAFQLVGATALELNKVSVLSDNQRNLDPAREQLAALAGALSAMDITKLYGHEVVESVLVTAAAARSALATIDFERQAMREPRPYPGQGDQLNVAAAMLRKAELIAASFEAIREEAKFAAKAVNARAEKLSAAVKVLENKIAQGSSR